MVAISLATPRTQALLSAPQVLSTQQLGVVAHLEAIFVSCFLNFIIYICSTATSQPSFFFLLLYCRQVHATRWQNGEIPRSAKGSQCGQIRRECPQINQNGYSRYMFGMMSSHTKKNMSFWKHYVDDIANAHTQPTSKVNSAAYILTTCLPVSLRICFEFSLKYITMVVVSKKTKFETDVTTFTDRKYDLAPAHTWVYVTLNVMVCGVCAVSLFTRVPSGNPEWKQGILFGPPFKGFLI